MSANTVRNRLHRVAERAEAALGDERWSFIEGCPGEPSLAWRASSGWPRTDAALEAWILQRLTGRPARPNSIRWER